MSGPAASCALMTAATASRYCSRNIESPIAALNERPSRFWSYHSGRGYDPVIAVGMTMSRVVLSMAFSLAACGPTPLVIPDNSGKSSNASGFARSAERHRHRFFPARDFSDLRAARPQGVVIEAAPSHICGVASIPTFAVRPSFLGTERSDRAAAICIAGIPYDLGTSNRPGARFGPAAIRQASRMLLDG